MCITGELSLGGNSYPEGRSRFERTLDRDLITGGDMLGLLINQGDLVTRRILGRKSASSASLLNGSAGKRCCSGISIICCITCKIICAS